MQQDVWPWGEWEGKVCIHAFIGGMFLPPRPLTLRLLFPTGWCPLILPPPAQLSQHLPDLELCLHTKQMALWLSNLIQEE